MNLMSLFRRPGGMSCEQVEAVLQQYLDSELSPDEVPKVLAHLKKCRDCGLEAETYTRIKDSLRSHQTAPSEESMQKLRAMAAELATSGPPTA